MKKSIVKQPLNTRSLCASLCDIALVDRVLFSGFLLGLVLCVMLMLVQNSHAAQTAYVAAADHNGGYANAVLDRVIEKWRPPQSNMGHIVRIMVMVDGDGKMTDCMAIAQSGSPAADKAACDAARAVGSFATPPYGLPMDVFLSFWMGTPDLTSVLPQSPAPVSPQAISPQTGVSPQSSQGAAVGQGPATEPVVIPSSPSTPVADIEPAVAPYVAAPTTATAPIPSAALGGREQPPQTSYKPTIQDARSGAVLDEKDYYVKRVMGKIGPLVVFPANMPRGKYSASIIVRVDGDGTFLNIDLDDSSGIAALDAAIMSAAGQIIKVHAPPSNKPEDLYLTFVVDNP